MVEAEIARIGFTKRRRILVDCEKFRHTNGDVLTIFPFTYFLNTKQSFLEECGGVAKLFDTFAALHAVSVTRGGERGAVLFRRSSEGEEEEEVEKECCEGMALRAEEVVDTIGCGDAFVAAIGFQLLRGGGTSFDLQFCNDYASLKCLKESNHGLLSLDEFKVEMKKRERKKGK